MKLENKAPLWVIKAQHRLAKPLDDTCLNPEYYTLHQSSGYMRTTTLQPHLEILGHIRAREGLGLLFRCTYHLCFLLSYSDANMSQNLHSWLSFIGVCKNEWVITASSLWEGTAREPCSHRATCKSVSLGSAIQAIAGCQEENTCPENRPFSLYYTDCAGGNMWGFMITHKSMKKMEKK